MLSFKIQKSSLVLMVALLLKTSSSAYAVSCGAGGEYGACAGGQSCVQNPSTKNYYCEATPAQKNSSSVSANTNTSTSTNSCASATSTAGTVARGSPVIASLLSQAQTTDSATLFNQLKSNVFGKCLVIDVSNGSCPWCACKYYFKTAISAGGDSGAPLYNTDNHVASYYSGCSNPSRMKATSNHQASTGCFGPGQQNWGGNNISAESSLSPQDYAKELLISLLQDPTLDVCGLAGGTVNPNQPNASGTPNPVTSQMGYGSLSINTLSSSSGLWFDYGADGKTPNPSSCKMKGATYLINGSTYFDYSVLPSSACKNIFKAIVAKDSAGKITPTPKNIINISDKQGSPSNLMNAIAAATATALASNASTKCLEASMQKSLVASNNVASDSLKLQNDNNQLAVDQQTLTQLSLQTPPNATAIANAGAAIAADDALIQADTTTLNNDQQAANAPVGTGCPSGSSSSAPLNLKMAGYGK